MPKLIDEIGNRYGRLVVVRRIRNKNMRYAWLCQCDCGSQSIVFGASLRRGFTKSCGCLRRENMLRLVTKHGMADTPEYHIWADLRQRCSNPNNHGYHNYGERGITVDPRWDDFTIFYTDMGPRPSPKHSIERIDNDGPYSPENCKWATKREQANNSRHNHLLTFNGETMNMTQWAKRLGINRGTLSSRITESKWSIEKSLTTPVR